ncbi:hypothetical protein HF086_001615 [Spodoptera exigua]|uniref:Uncharacterized protein n=1 Tax=Spodoptera exigua TaxID=7107 RepID=A0A922SA89_SPOEX|nr:hypothetical protein HF086_001615 [Spodoptera exigua]
MPNRICCSREGYQVSEGLAAAAGAAGPSPATGPVAAGSVATAPALAAFLSSLLPNSSAAPFGSGPAEESGAPDGAPGEAPGEAGWTPDEPHEQLDLAPAIMLDTTAGAALAGDGAPGAVERARVALGPGGALALEAGRPAPAAAALPAPAPSNASGPHAAVNVVQQRADALASHADSRGGGLASRF